MLSWMSIASCASVPDYKLAPRTGATVQCQTDCVSVSRTFLKEHADLFDEVIRARASLKMCQERP